MVIPYSTQVIEESDIQAVEQVLRSGWVTRGLLTHALEDELKGITGKGHNILVSNGTMALWAAIGCVEPAAVRILTTPLTFCAVSNAAYWNRMKVSFCDVDPETLCPDFPPFSSDDDFSVPVSLDYAGYPSLQHSPGHGNIVLDACHSFGARLDSGEPSSKYAHVACYSFHPAKQITGGEGGLVSTDSDWLADDIRQLRDNGRKNGLNTNPGLNLHMDEMSAALVYSQLGRLPDNLSRRREIAHEYYSAWRDDLRIILPIDHPGHAYHLFPIRLSEAVCESVEQIQKDLLELGIGTQRHYRPLHTQPLYAHRNVSLPIAEHAYERMISIPMYHGLTDQQQEQVIQAISIVLDRYSKG